MPWEERSLMDVRLRFVQDVHRPGWSIAEVCRRYQVSRKTGYKWLERFAKAGPFVAGFTARSEEHTSELQSRPQLVFRLLLLKKIFARQSCTPLDIITIRTD